MLLHAQKGFELGGWLGTSHYFGDLNTQFDLSMPGPAGGVVFRYLLNNRLALKVSGNYGFIRGDDTKSENSFENLRNLRFQSNIFDGSVQLEFNFLPYVHGSDDEYITPYFFSGVSFFKFNPKSDLEGTMYELQPLGTEGQLLGEEYLTTGLGMNLGFGLKMDINPLWSLNIELSTRILFTDYLDDVSTVYADKALIESLRGSAAAQLSDRSLIDPQIGAPGYQRGNSNTNDNYTYFGISLMRYFGSIACPEISR